MLALGIVAALLSSAAPDPAARAILDTAIARMGGLAALTAVDRMRLEVMTEWQRTEFTTGRPPVILSYELSTELRDYTIPAWRYSRRFFSPNGTSGVVDLVADSVAAMELNGRWQPQNVAYVDERDEVFTFAPERVLALAHAAADARALPDTLIDGTRYARVTASVGKFRPTLHFRRSDGLLARASFRAAQPYDFGLAPWGVMDVNVTYSRWQKIPSASLVLPMQLDVARVGRAVGEDEGRRGHAVVRHDLLGAPLVEREAEGQRIGGVIRDAEELADGGDVALAVRAVEALGDVEDEVGTDQREPRGEALVGLEPEDLAHRPEGGLDRVDGGGLVPLGVEIGLSEIVAKGSRGDVVGERGGGGVRPGWVSRRLGFEIEGESYPNCQRRPLQKRPSAKETSRHELGSTTKLK